MNNFRSHWIRSGIALLIGVGAGWIYLPLSLADSQTDELVERTGRQIERFWEQVPSFNCRESVTREKIEKEGKVEFKQELEFDYVALTNTRVKNLTVEELRLPMKKGIEKPDMPSLLETNGFPTLLLIFHPRYQSNYRYQVVDTGPDDKGSVCIRFIHIPGAGSTSGVMIQGKAYALELQGTAWIDSESGAVQKISAGLISPMKDINVEDFSAQVDYELRHFPSENESRWLPSRAIIELRTGLQHWRNVHHYSQYKRFIVEAQGAIAK
jgi:hypothetical protein